MSDLKSIIEAEIPQLKREMKAAIKRAMRTVLTRMLNWRNKHFAYDVGNIVGNTSILAQYVKKPFQITMETDQTKVPYAKFVVAMRGVNWSNKQTVEDFFHVLTEKGKEWLMRELRKELAKYTTTHLKVTVK